MQVYVNVSFVRLKPWLKRLNTNAKELQITPYLPKLSVSDFIVQVRKTLILLQEGSSVVILPFAANKLYKPLLPIAKCKAPVYTKQQTRVN